MTYARCAESEHVEVQTSRAEVVGFVPSMICPEMVALALGVPECVRFLTCRLSAQSDAVKRTMRSKIFLHDGASSCEGFQQNVYDWSRCDAHGGVLDKCLSEKGSGTFAGTARRVLRTK